MGIRIAVLGCRGQLGRWLVRLVESGDDSELVGAWDLEELDVGNPEAVDSLFRDTGAPTPDVLLNAAAFTAVDRCESEEPLATQVNGHAPAQLAARCVDAGVKLVHVGTDFVFAGDATRPYREDDVAAPRSAYGRSKLMGEQSVLGASDDFLVVRTSWVFGPGHNFVKTMVEQAARRARGEDTSRLRVVDDQTGSPTYARDLAEGMLVLVRAEAGGLVHLSGGGVASWWELARHAIDSAGFSQVEVDKIRAADYPRPATTPMYSVLDCSRAKSLGVELRPWREAVSEYLESDDTPVAGRMA